MDISKSSSCLSSQKLSRVTSSNTPSSACYSLIFLIPSNHPHLITLLFLLCPPSRCWHALPQDVGMPSLKMLACPPSRCWHALWLHNGSSHLHLYSLSRSYLVPRFWIYLPKMTAKSLSLAWISPWAPNLPIKLLTNTSTLKSSYLRLNITVKLFT